MTCPMGALLTPPHPPLPTRTLLLRGNCWVLISPGALVGTIQGARFQLYWGFQASFSKGAFGWHLVPQFSSVPVHSTWAAAGGVGRLPLSTAARKPLAQLLSLLSVPQSHRQGPGASAVFMAPPLPVFSPSLPPRSRKLAVATWPQPSPRSSSLC